MKKQKDDSSVNLAVNPTHCLKFAVYEDGRDMYDRLPIVRAPEYLKLLYKSGEYILSLAE